MSALIELPAVVLCVDDEPSILSALRRLLRPSGYRVLLAESGAAALALMATEQVDLVISDMRRPEMDGAQFLEQVRSREPQAIRILLTGYADIASTIAAINRGEIHRYIAKPWDDQDLLLAVRDGLARKQLEQENRALSALTREQNDALHKANTTLESRVKARTQELEQVNDMLNTTFAQLQENFLLSIDVFAGLLELRDGSVAGHSRKVAVLARRIAEKLQLGTLAVQDVYAAGLLHEVGRIGFPDSMLRKPVSLLVGEEQARYRRHTLSAEAALMPLGQLQRAAKLVRSQLERLDGNGFPDGLQGDEVPLGAQIVGLAADYFGLQSGRLAERRYSAAEAAISVAQGAGAHYDGSLVSAFQAVLQEEPLAPQLDRQIACSEVEPGMVLSRDLLSPQGTLLLAAGFVFDSRVVRQLKDFAQRENFKIGLYIRNEQAGDKAGAKLSVLTGALP